MRQCQGDAAGVASPRYDLAKCSSCSGAPRLVLPDRCALLYLASHGEAPSFHASASRQGLLSRSHRKQPTSRRARQKAQIVLLLGYRAFYRTVFLSPTRMAGGTLLKLGWWVGSYCQGAEVVVCLYLEFVLPVVISTIQFLACLWHSIVAPEAPEILYNVCCHSPYHAEWIFPMTMNAVFVV